MPQSELFGPELFKPGYFAVFSPCRKWRYTWEHAWDEPTAGKRRIAFLMLNPSKADELGPDPTVTRCINYAKDWGHSSLIVLNLFAFRATLPKDMKAAADPVGPMNDYYLRQFICGAGTVIAAWGADGVYRDRAAQVMSMLGRNFYCLGTTKHGDHPRHPLYLKRTTKPQLYWTQGQRVGAWANDAGHTTAAVQ